jgi:hypothetical protein
METKDMAIDDMYRVIRDDFHASVLRWAKEDISSARFHLDRAMKNARDLSDRFSKILGKEKI